ncbi:hypothetical protein [Streptomyces sp. NPDC046925]|uniref:hypothetical protein n=1 Tax=Streptomyces sp. NPDC046925 TaxID=3155375 RepID=UPI003408A6C9
MSNTPAVPTAETASAAPTAPATSPELPEGMTGAPWFTPDAAAAYGAPRTAVGLARRALKAGWTAVLECVDRPTGALIWRVVASALLRADDRDIFGLSAVTAEWHNGKYASGTRTFNGEDTGSSLRLAAVRATITQDGVTVVDREAEGAGTTHRGRDLEHWLTAGDQHAERAWAATWRAEAVQDECASVRRQNGFQFWALVEEEWDALMHGEWDANTVAARRACVPLWVDMAEHRVYAHCRTTVRIAQHAEAAIRRIRVLAWEAESHQVPSEPAPVWAPTARDAWEHARRARILADRAETIADDARAARIDAEAESECAPAVAAEYARQHEQDAQRAADHPDDTPDAYARSRGMFEQYRPAWVAWERDNRRPSETLGEAYDRRGVITKGGWSSAELQTGETTRHARNRAIFALGIAAAKCAENPRGWDRAQCTALREAAEHGQTLYGPGASPGKGERESAAARVWRMLVPRADRWGSGFDFMNSDRDIARLDEAGWAATGAADETDALRRTLLIEHGLNLRTELMTDMKRERDARDALRSRRVGDAHHAARLEAIEGGADEDAATAAGYRAGSPVRAAMDAERNAGEAAWVATLWHGERVTGGHMVLLGTYWLQRAHAARLAAEDAARAAEAAPGSTSARTNH